jgi:hypothetical protein
MHGQIKICFDRDDKVTIEELTSIGGIGKGDPWNMGTWTVDWVAQTGNEMRAILENIMRILKAKIPTSQ